MKDDRGFSNYNMMNANCSPCKCPRIYYRSGNTSRSAAQEQYRSTENYRLTPVLANLAIRQIINKTPYSKRAWGLL